MKPIDGTELFTFTKLRTQQQQQQQQQLTNLRIVRFVSTELTLTLQCVRLVLRGFFDVR